MNKETVSKPISKITKKSDRPTTANSNVVQKMLKENPVFTARKNNFGNVENSETVFVFDIKTNQVIGKQRDDGKVDDLTEEDIEVCKKFKFTYVIPDNLDKGGIEVDDEVVEMDDDVDDDVEEEEEEDITIEDE